MAIELLCLFGGEEIHGSILAALAPFPLSLLGYYCNLRQVRNPTPHQSSNVKGSTEAWDISAYDQHHGLYAYDKSLVSYAGRRASTLICSH